MNDHPCRVCGASFAPYGFKQPNGEYLFYCRQHRLNGAPPAAPTLDLGLNVNGEASFERYRQSRHDWGTKFMAFVRFKVPPGSTGLGEVWRLEAEKRIGPPPDDHVVGAVIRRAKADGLLEETGRFLPPRDRKSNASKKGEWRRTEKV